MIGKNSSLFRLIQEREIHADYLSRTSLLPDIKRNIYTNASPSHVIQHGAWDNLDFRKSIYGSIGLLKRLYVSNNLEQHSGCVNTITWNQDGSKLLSGSDDNMIVLWDMPRGSVATSFHSGHQHNIFGVDFLSNTNDTQVVSIAADGLVRHHNLLTDTHASFQCHHEMGYEVAVDPQNPFVFLSCSEDGTVRQYDLRVTSSCICRGAYHHVLLRLSGLTRSEDVEPSTTPVLSMKLNPTDPMQLLVGGSDGFVRLYDRRQLSIASSFALPEHTEATYLFCPHHLRARTFPERCRVTSLKYNYDGTQFIVSYSGDYIYNVEPRPYRSESDCLERRSIWMEKWHPSHHSNLYTRHRHRPHGTRLRPTRASFLTLFDRHTQPREGTDTSFSTSTSPESRTVSTSSEEVDGEVAHVIEESIAATQGLPVVIIGDADLTHSDDADIDSILEQSMETDSIDTEIDRMSHDYVDGYDPRNESSSSSSSSSSSTSSSSNDDNNDHNEDSIETRRHKRHKRDIRVTADELQHDKDILMVYKGHRNVRTMIKEADYFGCDSEYVVSGSDDGRIFFWDCRSGDIVHLLGKADLQVVNCVLPHPTVPVLATSGIDHDIKVWEPVAESVKPISSTAIRRIMAHNEYLLQRHPDTLAIPLAAFLRLFRGGTSL